MTGQDRPPASARRKAEKPPGRPADAVAGPPPAAPAARVRVWDPLVRLLHWTLVTAVAVAWFSSERWGRLHEAAGWLALAVVGLRLVWGVAGGRHARFAGFVRGPRRTLGYARTVLRRHEPRHLGHNPLGGWMVVALLACVTAVGVTGWMYTTDRWWGDPDVEAVHEALAWTLVGLVVLHVAGVVFTSLRHRENLVRAMLDGTKPPAGPGDVA